MGAPEVPALAREADLLLCGARLDLEPPHRQRILQLVETGLDWPYLLRMAAWHGLRPLLYRHLNAIASPAVPQPVFVELWGNHEATARRNRGMARELSKILAALDAHDIPAIPYKGPALAAFVYGDLALREFGDLDILLRPADLLKAKARLEGLGYRAQYPLAPAAEAAFLRSSSQYHVVLRHPEHATLVELHWKTDPDYPVEQGTDQWWKQLGRTRLDAADIRCFSVEELVLVLCLHGTKHYWGSLGWLVDVAELLRQHPRLDWEWIAAKAGALACTRRLAVGLRLAHRLLEAPLPAQALSAFQGMAEVEKLATDMAASLFPPRQLSAFERLGRNLRLYERLGQRLSHCVSAVLAPSLIEWSRWPLPRALFILYVPLRLARLTRKYMRVS